MAPIENADNSGIRIEEKCEQAAMCDDDEDDDDDKFEDSFATHPEEEEDQTQHKGCSIIEDGQAISPSSILPSFVHTGLKRKAPLTELKYWIALSLTLDGRDKITKVLQYSSRLLAWWFLSKVKNSKTRHGHGQRFTNFYKSLGKSRKAFRLGRSINELQKISNVGLLGLFCWHLKQQHLQDSGKATGDEEIGKNVTDDQNTKLEQLPLSCISSPSSSSSSRSTATRKLDALCHRVLSVIYSSLVAVFPSNDESRVQWWKVIGSSFKTIGMFGYWMGDNANFLTSSGALDNYSLSDKDRLARRKRWLEITGKKANQFYFFATIIGLATNAYAYYRFQLKNSMQADGLQQIEGSKSNKSDATEQKQQEEKQFVLSLALLKSCMDFIVFSNNPGIDLHKRWRGRKNHEVIHCLCGLISAGTSLYSNFPDAKI